MRPPDMERGPRQGPPENSCAAQDTSTSNPVTPAGRWLVNHDCRGDTEALYWLRAWWRCHRLDQEIQTRHQGGTA